MSNIIWLWLPILVSAVFVFVVSSIMHTVLTYHNKDFKKVGDEDGLMDAVRQFNVSPGDYVIPYAGNHKNAKSPEFKAKLDKGPVWFMTVFPTGQLKMGASLVQWFVYCIIVGIFAAYITGHSLYAGAHYLPVFRYAASTAFIGYGLALAQNSIWYKRSWKITFLQLFDALIYGLVTGGVFGWLYP
jgi:hypothetical protein